MREITPVVKQLLIVNILFFIGSQIVDDRASDLLAMHYITSEKFQLWQPLTHMFMHGGIMHIAFNMFALFSFGSSLESFWGGKKFLFFYISCGLGAVALHTAIDYYSMQNIISGVAHLNLSDDILNQILNSKFSSDNYYRSDLFLNELERILQGSGKLSLLDQTSFDLLFEAARNNQTAMLGASGAVYGLLVAFAFMFPSAELMMLFLPIPIRAKYFVPLILLGDLYLGLTGKSIFGGSSGIAHFAHIGGALIGFLMMLYWRNNKFKHNRWN